MHGVYASGMAGRRGPPRAMFVDVATGDEMFCLSDLLRGFLFFLLHLLALALPTPLSLYFALSNGKKEI